MDFYDLINIANKNDAEASTEGTVKRYSTTFAPAKKMPKSNVKNDAIRLYLKRKEAEEKEKAEVARQRKEKLLELRSKNAKDNKRAKIMASRTKDNDFSRIKLTEDELEAKRKREAELMRRELNDKVARMKARIEMEEQEKLLPHKRKRKSKKQEEDELGEQDDDEANEEETTDYQQEDEPTASVSSEKDHSKKKKKRPPMPTMSFEDLLKVASTKQHEPVKLPDKSKEKDVRPLTKKGRKLLEEAENRERRKLAAAAANGKLLKDANSNKPKVTNSSVATNENHDLKEKKSFSIPKMNQPKEKVSNSQSDKLSKLKVPAPVVKRPSSEYESSEKKKQNISSSKPSNKEMANHKPISAIQKKPHESAKSEFKRPKDISVTKNSQKVPQNNTKSKPISQKVPQNNTKSKPTSQKVPQNITKSKPNLESKTPAPVKETESTGPKMPDMSSLLGVFGKDFIDQIKQMALEKIKEEMMGSLKSSQPQSDEALRTSNSNSMKPKKPSSELQKSSIQKPGQSSKPPGSSSNAVKQPFPPKISAAKTSSTPNIVKLKGVENSNIPSNKKPPGVRVGEMVPRNLKTESMRTEPIRTKVPPPRPIQRRQESPKFHPNPYLQPPRRLLESHRPERPMKRRIESSDEDDDEDDDMSDFIDDGPCNVNDDNVSEYIKDIFGYDRSRYIGMDDDDIIESSYLEQETEEKRSARLGLREDQEEERRQEAELKRKLAKKQQKNIK